MLSRKRQRREIKMRTLRIFAYPSCQTSTCLQIFFITNLKFSFLGRHGNSYNSLWLIVNRDWTRSEPLSEIFSMAILPFTHPTGNFWRTTQSSQAFRVRPTSICSSTVDCMLISNRRHLCPGQLIGYELRSRSERYFRIGIYSFIYQKYCLAGSLSGCWQSTH